MSLFTPIRASNALITETNVPKTAVFVGGTDGIGKASLKNLVSRGFPIKVYVVGRDEAGHQGLMDDLRASNPKAVLVYMEGQVSLVAEAQRIADQIAAQEEQIDLLFLSAGFLPFKGRQETSEGLELCQAVAYYSRVVFITRLLRHLRKAAEVSESARVVNILAAGQESTNLFLDDMLLKHPGRFSIPTCAAHIATSTALTLKRISEQPENKNIVFINAHPGLVSTDLFTKSGGATFNPSKPSVPPPDGTPAQLTPEESGERCLYLITSGEYGGSGVSIQNGRQAAQTLAHGLKASLFSVNHRFEVLEQDKLLADLETMGATQKIWDYTFGAIESITKTGWAEQR